LIKIYNFQFEASNICRKVSLLYNHIRIQAMQNRWSFQWFCCNSKTLRVIP